MDVSLLAVEEHLGEAPVAANHVKLSFNIVTCFLY
jgi:hypothetical protein